ncbi:MAG: isoleucine--tRNA ligase [Chloroflexi bacterium]|nr:isoleucine--tRNA ligase [Chloroflexota bacterium]
MAIQKAPNEVDFIKQEHQTLKFWDDIDAFNTLRTLHKGKPPWSFIDGPITANNPMGVHHGWGRTYKDLFNRFWSMNGRELRYQNGFDCQGLWVEVEVEKEKNFKSKKDIESYGLAKFVRECKARVLKYAAIQTEQSIRLGYWMDWNSPDLLRELAVKLMDDPLEEITVPGLNGPVTDTVEQIVGRLGLQELGGSYFTFSNENNFMIWKFIKKTWENGWLYRGADVMPWCPRCATAISQHEIVTDGYAELTHRSVTLLFPLRDRPGESLLVWTTTPWTLTSNVAAAVGPELTYLKVQVSLPAPNEGQKHIVYLSKGTLAILRGEYKVLEELKGAQMEGWTYDGPFDDLPAAKTPGGVTELKELKEGITQSGVEAHQVILWEEVGEEEGTGIVHIAPGCGAEDFQLSFETVLPRIAPLTEEGYFVDGFGWLTGKHVSEVTEEIFANLEEKGILYHIEPYTHRYPTCWRCKTELVFRLVDEWFISMGENYDKPREEVTAEEKEASLRYQIMDVVDQIRWIPEFGHARELDWLRNMHDWMISKKRYWGLALPIWVCSDCDHFHVVGDDQELEERAIEGYEAYKGHTPHRPYIDEVVLACDKCGSRMNRIPDVGNPWLDAGIVPFSTLSYRVDPGFWEKWYPAHWISESLPGQFRNWFYSLLAMGTVLDGSPPFLENFSYASLQAEDGREMHKSTGNSIEFNEAADIMGVDVMRWLYCSHKPENNLLFGYHKAEETRRHFIIPFWNVYSFFTTYAEIDGWAPEMEGFDPDTPEGATPESQNSLDRWVLGRLNQTVDQVSKDFTDSNAYNATLAFESMLDDLSNWYVRRSRRRYWKTETDQDKSTAYATLWHVLVKMIRALAPVLPFLTEEIYQNLVRSVYPDARESIHHTIWPKADSKAIDQKLIDQMKLARETASQGLSARSNAGIKVRQPLSQVLVFVKEGQAELDDELVEIIQDELNVKGLEFVQDSDSLLQFVVLPDNKVLGPKYGQDFPKVKEALAKLDPNEVATRVNEGLTVSTDSGYVFLPEEILVSTNAAEGFATVDSNLLTVGLDTEITPALRDEGLAREIIRRIQDFRKQADYNIADRIHLVYKATPALKGAIEAHRGYIMEETLTLEMKESDPEEGMFSGTASFEGEETTLGLKVV